MNKHQIKCVDTKEIAFQAELDIFASPCYGL